VLLLVSRVLSGLGEYKSHGILQWHWWLRVWYTFGFDACLIGVHCWLLEERQVLAFDIPQKEERFSNLLAFT